MMAKRTPEDLLEIPAFLRVKDDKSPERLKYLARLPPPKYQLGSMVSTGKISMSRSAEEIKTERREKALAAAPAIQEAIAAGAWTMDDLRKALPNMADDQLQVGVELLKARKRTTTLAASKPRIDNPFKATKSSLDPKLDQLRLLFTRKEGCSTADMLKITGWKAVSMPAMAIKLGLTLRQVKEKGNPTRYFGTK